MQPQSRFTSRLMIAFFTFTLLIIVGITGYRWLEGMSFVDAFYMTVITISTVGFGEVRALSPTGRLFTIALILGGGGVAAFAISTVTEWILTGEWQSTWELRRRKRMYQELTNHVIVCGFGRMGRHVANELSAEGIPFIIVDVGEEKVDEAKQQGFVAYLGNAANEAVLQDVGIERARGLVATANSDSENVFIALTARSLKEDLMIVARANHETSEPKLLKAGANRVIMPYQIGGKRTVTTLIRPGVADFLDEVVYASGLELLLEQVRIEPGSALAGQTLSALRVRSNTGAMVLAYRNPDGSYNTYPGPETTLVPGTMVIAMGTREQLHELMQLAKLG